MTKPVLIMTRPGPSAKAFVQSLPPNLRAKLSVVISPLLQINATDARVDMAGVAGVIFTSAHGVAHGPQPQACPVFCVGPKTTEAAVEKGWAAQTVGQDADELVETLVAMRPDFPLMHSSGQHQRGDIAAKLTRAGLLTRQAIVYEQALLPLTALAKTRLGSGTHCIVPLFSPRTAVQFAAQCHDLRNVSILALSAAVAETLVGKGPKQLLTANEPTAASMRLALETLV